MPHEAAFHSVREDLKDSVFQDVDGFLAKYFEGRSWWAAVKNKCVRASQPRPRLTGWPMVLSTLFTWML